MVGSGRTDAGVHAVAQVAHVKTRSSISYERLRHSLNQLLPPDISVMRVDDAPPASTHVLALRANTTATASATGRTVRLCAGGPIGSFFNLSMWTR